MKKLILVFLALSATNAFALDAECLNRIHAVMQNLKPEAAIALTENPSESVVDRGVVYQMTKVLVTFSDGDMINLRTVIVYERPSLKCMIRNIL
jgi:hypothetical protein